MTVPNEIPSNNYVANGVVKKFSVTFHYETADTLRIKLNGNEPSTDKYYIDDVDHSFNFYLPPNNGDIIYIYRKTPLERDIDYDNNYNSFRPKTVNTDFDRVWRVTQESFEKLNKVDIDYDFVLNQVRPIETGGTGANNIVDAQTNLDVYNKAEVDALVATGGQGNIVPIAGGGTGADNAGSARENLSVYSIQEVDSEISDAISAIPNATETIAGKARLATQAEAQAGISSNTIVTPSGLRQALNATGDAPVIAFRAWATIDGTTGVVKKGVGFSSVSKVSTGQFVCTLTISPPDSNYAVLLTNMKSTAYNSTDTGVAVANETGSKTTTGFKINATVTGTANAYADNAEIFIGVIY